jgi:hypothetical protein
MRRLNLVLAAASVGLVAACHDTTVQPTGPDHTKIQHFDSLSAQAKAAGQTNRVAALDLMLRTLADGGIVGSDQITTGAGAGNFLIYSSLAWSIATEVVKPGTNVDSVTDSLMVLTAWSGANADTMLVVRVGNPKLAQQVKTELATLGLTAAMPRFASDTVKGDTVSSAAIVVGNTVIPADSGGVSASYAIFGSGCVFVDVTSVQNDKGTQCVRELFDFTFDLRFSPSISWGLMSNAPGVVIVH